MEDFTQDSFVEEQDLNEEYFVYLIIDPITDDPIYVGKAKDVMRRLGGHLTHDNLGNWEMDVFFRNLRKQLIFPKFKVLEKCCGYNIKARERYWVQHYCSIYTTMKNIQYKPKPEQVLEIRKSAQSAPVQYPDLSKS